MASPGNEGSAQGGIEARSWVKRAAITGTALTIPLLLTLVVLQLALGVVAQIIAPLVAGLQLIVGLDTTSELLLEVSTAATLVLLVLAVGFAAEYRQDATGLSRGFDALMARIPGLGSVYTGVRGLSEVILEQDTESFKAVKLVEFPREGSYMLGFVTATPPATVVEAAGHESMRTLFIPLAPNPVMGGFLANLPAARVHDIDLTVEEGVQAVVTSGAAIDPRVEETDAPDSLAGHELPSVSDLEESIGAGRILDADFVDGRTPRWSDEDEPDR